VTRATGAIGYEGHSLPAYNPPHNLLKRNLCRDGNFPMNQPPAVEPSPQRWMSRKEAVWLKREALADAALAILATDAEGAESIRRVLESIFVTKPAVALRIAAEAKSGRLRPKYLKSN
jgi:hypothetical protein